VIERKLDRSRRTRGPSASCSDRDGTWKASTEPLVHLVAAGAGRLGKTLKAPFARHDTPARYGRRRIRIIGYARRGQRNSASRVARTHPRGALSNGKTKSPELSVSAGIATRIPKTAISGKTWAPPTRALPHETARGNGNPINSSRALPRACLWRRMTNNAYQFEYPPFSAPRNRISEARGIM